jgi:diguanylate cyclase (GGDEF)-like protein
MVVLLLLLRQQHRERRFFHLWCMAWLSLSLALVALVVGPDAVFKTNAIANPNVLAFSYMIYLLGKFGFYLLLVAGTLSFAGNESSQVRKMFHVCSSVLLVLALLLPWFQPDLNVLVWAQSPVVCIAGILCAYLFWRQDYLRSFGTRYCAMMLLAMSMLWFFYGMAFPTSEGVRQDESSPLILLTKYNSYFDLLIQQLLAFGFVVLLLEQGRREIDLAHVKLNMAHEKLKNIVLHDQLTGAGNRLALNEYRRGEQRECTLIVCDLDYLKPINDQYGHDAGDQLLAHFVAVLRQGLPEPSKIFRIGGDEFVLVVPAATPIEALGRVRGLLLQSPILMWRQQPLRLRASLGAAHWPEGQELEAVFQQADLLMYEDKRNNKTLQLDLMTRP